MIYGTLLDQEKDCTPGNHKVYLPSEDLSSVALGKWIESKQDAFISYMLRTYPKTLASGTLW